MYNVTFEFKCLHRVVSLKCTIEVKSVLSSNTVWFESIYTGITVEYNIQICSGEVAIVDNNVL